MSVANWAFGLALLAALITVGRLASEVAEGNNVMSTNLGTAGQPKPTRYLVLHHELLYPAFLGAVLFEFARKIIEDGFAEFFSKVIYGGLSNELLWFLSALWFLLYFTVAFFALAETKTPDKFGICSFIANLLEIGV